MQTETITLIEKVRKAIDDIKKDVEDDFYDDADTEIEQALLAAAGQIVREVGTDMLIPQKAATATVVASGDNGSSTVDLPTDYSRFYSLKMKSWPMEVMVLTAPGTNKAQQQACKWTQGTKEKPVVMESMSATGRALRLWPNDSTDSLEYFYYIPVPEIGATDGKLNVAVKDDAEMSIVYRAAGIYLEGKKESELANRMYKLSEMNYGVQREV